MRNDILILRKRSRATGRSITTTTLNSVSKRGERGPDGPLSFFADLTSPIYFLPMSLYDDLYTFLLDGGDSDILEEARQRAKEDMRRKDILEKHPYKITEIAENGRPGRFQTYILVDGKRKLIRKTQKNDLEDYLIKFYDGDISKNSLEKVYAEWIKVRKLVRTSSTVKKDVWVWDTYYKGTDFAKADISMLKAPTITSYLLEKVRNMGLTQRKFREMKSLLNAVLDYAVQMDYISHNPSREIHRRSFLHLS